MFESNLPVERTITRRIFVAWSVDIPATFAESFVEDGSYWHAFDDERSVSLSSIVLRDALGPVTAERILLELPPLEGEPLDELPSGLMGRAAYGPAMQPAIAANALSGMVAVDGRLLIATVTGNDMEWAIRVWRSIRSCQVDTSPVAGRRRPLKQRGNRAGTRM
jgi:hypothetical protein